jgi:predicted dithiol-disulfide oxidoreductase (DUF899 family)
VDHPVVSHDEWLAARGKLLEREKEFTQQREQLARERRDLPWEEVTKDYAFDGPDGERTLASLFDGRSQLIVYHFMFPPEWDAGCPHCSFWADHFDGTLPHLKARDVTLTAVSRAPIGKITAYQQRMGWSFPWVSSGRSEFSYDYGASFPPEQVDAPVYNYGHVPGFTDREGISVFADGGAGRLFRTYSTYARGIDMVNATYQFLDLVPRGRDEPSEGNPQFWVRRHDEYGTQ